MPSRSDFETTRMRDDRLKYNDNNTSNSKKWLYSFIGGMLFLLLSNEYAYNATSSIFYRLFGQRLAIGGCANMTGLLVHTIVYIVLIKIMMG